MIQKANWNLYKLTVLPKNSLFLYFRDPSLIINSSSFPFPFPFPSPKHFISKTQKKCQFPYIEIKFYTEEQYHKYLNTSPLPFPSRPIFPSIHPKALPSSKSKSSQTTSNQFLLFIFFFFKFLKNSSLYLFSPQFPIFPTQKHTPNFLPPISQTLPRKKNTILVLGSALSSSFSDNHEKKIPLLFYFDSFVWIYVFIFVYKQEQRLEKSGPFLIFFYF